MTFEEFMPSIHAKWRAVWDFDKTDMRKAFEAGRKEGVERAAEIAEGGRFLHDDAPDAKFGKAVAAAIRKEANNE